jgi:predicted aldo/keto reductase-like oxidoreductase
MQMRMDTISEHKLSALGLGCMRLPSDKAKADAIVVEAVQMGINFFDTAHLYPGSEVTLGGILARHGLRDKVYISTKLPHFRCRSAADFDKYFSEQLTRLQTDYIDYYLIHNIGSVAAWRRLESLGIRDWISKQKRMGTLRRIGFSFHGKAGEFVPLLDSYNWEFAMIQLNYMNETYQAGLAGLMELAKRGMPAIIMEPLLGGKLAGNIAPAAREIFHAADPLRTPADWALRWLWDKAEVTVVLSGMSTPEQLHQNAAAIIEPSTLTENERNVYKQAYDAVKESFRIPCTGCNYCMPCHRGVNVPAVFTAYNTSYTYGWFHGVKMHMTGSIDFSAKRAGPTACHSCSACTGKCPQDIVIPTALRTAARRIEPFYLRPIIKLVKKIIS